MSADLVGLCFPGQPTAIDPESFFVGAEDPRYVEAVRLCAACPLMWDCQDAARAEGIPYGTWGGESDRLRWLYWRQNGGRPEHFTKTITRFAGPTSVLEVVA